MFYNRIKTVGVRDSMATELSLSKFQFNCRLVFSHGVFSYFYMAVFCHFTWRLFAWYLFAAKRRNGTNQPPYL